MADIGTWLTFIDAFDLVALEGGFERLEEIDFGALAALFGGFLVKRALEIVDLPRELQLIVEGFGFLGVDRIYRRFLKSLALLSEPRRQFIGARAFAFLAKFLGLRRFRFGIDLRP